MSVIIYLIYTIKVPLRQWTSQSANKPLFAKHFKKIPGVQIFNFSLDFLSGTKSLYLLIMLKETLKTLYILFLVGIFIYYFGIPNFQKLLEEKTIFAEKKIKVCYFSYKK